MKLIESSVQIIKEKDPYKMIELAGRTCYKSEDKITEDSAKEFVDRMIKLGHGAMLEHGTIYLACLVFDGDVDNNNNLTPNHRFYKYQSNKYSKVKVAQYAWSGEDVACVTTNLRVLVENNWLDDLKHIDVNLQGITKNVSQLSSYAIAVYHMNLYVIAYLALLKRVLVTATIVRINLIMRLYLLYQVGQK